MVVAGTQSFSLRQDEKPLLWGLLISLAAHGLLFAAAYGLASALYEASKQHALLDLQRFHPAKPPPVLQEPTLVFVEVNPDQATAQAPKNPKFYSAKNSVAANVDAQTETDTPKIDGSQIHVPKTETVPRTRAFPLQPSAPKESPPEKPAESKPQKPPGDLAM